MKSHFDAWGNPILEHFELISYYSGDGKSMAVVRNNMPHHLICFPSIEIEINPLVPEEFWVNKVWPGGSKRISHNMNQRTLEALRRLYVSRRGAWKVLEVNGRIRFTRKGVARRCHGGRNLWAC
jgi:hypothetical protein